MNSTLGLVKRSSMATGARHPRRRPGGLRPAPWLRPGLGWSAATAPVAGLSPSAGAPHNGNGEVLDQVSCPAAGWRVAVGWYTAASNRTLGLIETLSGGMWTERAVPESYM